MVARFYMFTGNAIVSMQVCSVKNYFLALQREILVLSRMRQSLRKRPLMTCSAWFLV